VSVNDPAADPARSLAAWWQARTGQDKLDDVPGDLRGLVKAGPEKTTKPEDVERIRRHWLTNLWAAKPEPLAAALAAVAANGKAKADLEKQIPLTFVFADQPKMRDSFVMQRGAYDSPGEKVERGTPAFLPPLAVTEGKVPDRPVVIAPPRYCTDNAAMVAGLAYHYRLRDQIAARAAGTPGRW